MAKVSVIIPIYNVENYIEKCLKSLEEQNFKDLEIILVNDGSTDSSGEIAKKWAEKNSNSKYLEKENGGLSDARNYGLKYATGEYISFIDSDDYIEKDLFSRLDEYMNQEYDLIKFQINIVNEEGKILEQNSAPVFEHKTGEEAFEILFGTDKLMEPAWGYLYKASFWKENNFEYAKGLYHEDFGLIPLIILKAKRVVSTSIKGYNYVQTKTSITRGNDERKYKQAKDLIIHYDNMMDKIISYDISQRSKDNIKIYYTNCIILNVENLEGDQREKYIKEIKIRKLYKNIKVRNLKQLIKRILLAIDVEKYLKIR